MKIVILITIEGHIFGEKWVFFRFFEKKSFKNFH